MHPKRQRNKTPKSITKGMPSIVKKKKTHTHNAKMFTNIQTNSEKNCAGINFICEAPALQFLIFTKSAKNV